MLGYNVYLVMKNGDKFDRVKAGPFFTREEYVTGEMIRTHLDNEFACEGIDFMELERDVEEITIEIGWLNSERECKSEDRHIDKLDIFMPLLDSMDGSKYELMFLYDYSTRE